jgi:hypothetical protein
MHEIGRRASRALTLFASCGLACLFLAVAGAGTAKSQEIEPSDFVPAPAGTNLLLGYYYYGHGTEYNLKDGPTIKDSGVEVNIGVARYGHYFDVAGHPAGLQIYQPFGSQSGAHVDGLSLGSTFGAGDTILSGAFWPYANAANKTYVVGVVYLNVPDGGYNPRSQVNIGDNRLSGDVQVGMSKGIGDRFSFDAAFDATFYADNTDAFPGGQRLNQAPTYRGQLWLNWAWSRAFSTSIGWDGLFGGRQNLDGIFTGASSEEQRVRAAALLFLSPRFQTTLELNHDVEHSGNFKQEFGAILRLLYIF